MENRDCISNLHLKGGDPLSLHVFDSIRLQYFTPGYMQKLCGCWDILTITAPKKFIFKNQRLIFMENTDSIFYLKSGRIRTNIPHFKDRLNICTDFGPGMIIRENCLFGASSKEYINHTCILDGIIYFFSKQEIFNNIIPNYPKLTENLLFVMAIKTDHADFMRMVGRCHNSLQRLAIYIYSLFIYHKCNMIKTYFTHEDLGDILGISKANFIRHVNILKKLRIISRFTKSSLIIQDENLLKILATQNF